MTLSTFIIGAGCLLFAIILAIIATILICRDKMTLFLFVLVFIGSQAVMLSFFYFNASIPLTVKVKDIHFKQATQAEGSTIETLLFMSDNKTVCFTQGKQHVETPFAMVNEERLQFVSPIDNCSYICDIIGNKRLILTNRNLHIKLYPEGREGENILFGV